MKDEDHIPKRAWTEPEGSAQGEFERAFRFLSEPRPPLSAESRERWFFDAIEGLLSASEQAEFEKFLLLNPEFGAEWESWEATLLAPDESIYFDGIESLLKPEAEGTELVPAGKKRSAGGRRRALIIPLLAAVTTTAAAAVIGAVFIGPQFFGVNQPNETTSLMDRESDLATPYSFELAEVAVGVELPDNPAVLESEEVAILQTATASGGQLHHSQTSVSDPLLQEAVEDGSSAIFAEAFEDGIQFSPVKSVTLSSLSQTVAAVEIRNREHQWRSLAGTTKVETDGFLAALDGPAADWFRRTGESVSAKTKNTARDVALFMSGESLSDGQSEEKSSLSAAAYQGNAVEKRSGFRIGKTTFEFERRKLSGRKKQTGQHRQESDKVPGFEPGSQPDSRKPNTQPIPSIEEKHWTGDYTQSTYGE